MSQPVSEPTAPVDARITLALSQPPVPEGGAPGRCAIALLRGLSSHGVQVTAIAADRRRRRDEALEVPTDLPVSLVPTRETLGRLALYAAKGARPRGELSRGAFAAAFEAAARGADLMHLEETETGWCAYPSRQPRVLHLHYLAQLDQASFGMWGRDPLRSAEEVYAEIRLVRAHRWVVASSPDVADRVRRISPRSEVIEAPLSLDPQYYAPALLDGPPIAGIIGTATWPPTRSAIHQLAHRVWPRVHTGLPESRLHIAGRGTAELPGLVGAPGVVVVGEVPSASDFLCGISVLAYPLSRGSGMKVKVMEALASGVPVVTTPLGAQGIGATDGVVVETTVDRTAAAVRELLTDPEARAQRGAAGRAHFLDHLAPGPATAPLVAAYALALSS